MSVLSKCTHYLVPVHLPQVSFSDMYFALKRPYLAYVHLETMSFPFWTLLKTTHCLCACVFTCVRVLHFIWAEGTVGLSKCDSH